MRKQNLNMTRLTFSLSWETTKESPHGLDLDIAAFMLSAEKRIPEARNFVFYNNISCPDKAIFLAEDDRTGQIGETMNIDLTRIPSHIEEIILVAGVFEGKQKSITFGDTRNAVAILTEDDTRTEICRYILNTAFPNAVTMEFGRLFYRFNRWRFEALGIGYADGFSRFVDKFVV